MANDPFAQPPISDGDLQRYLKERKGLDFSGSEINNALIKLKEDKLIRIHTENPITTYLITWDGRLKVEQGGYQADHDKLFVQKAQLNNSYRVNFYIAISTGIAAIYYFLQIFDGETKKHPCIAILTLAICISLIILWEVWQSQSKRK